MIKRVGYIGLGLMGKPIASNLLKAGFELTVHNRSQAAVEELVSLGASEAGSPAHVAEASELVITNLPDSSDVEQVVLGHEGVLAGAADGMIFADNSTIKPETARDISHALAEKGVSALDAPVSGGDVGAQAGTLAIMVGGPREAFDRALPIFEAIGQAITYVGESGAGQVAKACNQIMVTAQMVAMGELLLLAQRAGVSPAKVVEVINEATTTSGRYSARINPPPLSIAPQQAFPALQLRQNYRDRACQFEASTHTAACGWRWPAAACRMTERYPKRCQGPYASYKP